MNTSLSNLYAELAVSRVQLDEDEFILDLISRQLNQLNQISEEDNHAIVLIKQRRKGYPQAGETNCGAGGTAVRSPVSTTEKPIRISHPYRFCVVITFY